MNPKTIGNSFLAGLFSIKPSGPAPIARSPIVLGGVRHVIHPVTHRPFTLIPARSHPPLDHQVRPGIFNFGSKNLTRNG